MPSLLARSFSIVNKSPYFHLNKVRNINTTGFLRNEKPFSHKEPLKEMPNKRFEGKAIGPITWKSLGISTVLGAGILGYMYYLKGQKDKAMDRERRRQLGKAQIGGQFQLVDHNNKVVKSQDFLGKWMLLYFGFTHCPDVCPDELEKLAAVVKKLEKDHKLAIQPIFITVDPERDTPEVVGKYVKEFSDKIIGLTGSTEQLAKVCKTFRVYFSNGPKEGDDYIVDHTIIMYLMDPEGLFVDYYGQTQTVKQMVDSVLKHKKKFDDLMGPDWEPTLPSPMVEAA